MENSAGSAAHFASVRTGAPSREPAQGGPAVESTGAMSRRGVRAPRWLPPGLWKHGLVVAALLALVWAASTGFSPGADDPEVPEHPPIVVPDAARAHTTGGAVAFAAWVPVLIDASAQDPSQTVLQSLSMPRCVSCTDVSRTLARWQEDRVRQAAPTMTVRATTPVEGSTPDRQIVDVAVSGRTVDLVDSKGRVVGEQSPPPSPMRVVAVWMAGQWMVEAVDPVDDPSG